MYDAGRGAIKYLDRYKQLLSFEGMERHRHITPTDIDGVIDYNGAAFVFLEAKHANKYSEGGLAYGQRLALENLVKSHLMSGHQSIAIVFTHRCKPDEIIYVKERPVVELFSSNDFNPTGKTVIDVIVEFEEFCKTKGLNI